MLIIREIKGVLPKYFMSACLSWRYLIDNNNSTFTNKNKLKNPQQKYQVPDKFKTS